jgi:hypothetical protein
MFLLEMAIARRPMVVFTAATEQPRMVCVAKPCRRFGQRIEHSLQIKRQPADHLKHVGGRGLLLQRFAQLVEQPRVLDGDDGLSGEIAQQLDLLFSAPANLTMGASGFSIAKSATWMTCFASAMR